MLWFQLGVEGIFIGRLPISECSERQVYLYALGFDQTFADRILDQLAAVVETQLAHQVFPMAGDGVLADRKLVCNFVVVLATCHCHQDFMFARVSPSSASFVCNSIFARLRKSCTSNFVING